jgi:hypothetical protein
MNCKPGDTAFVIRNCAGFGCIDSFIGRPIETSSQFNTDIGPAWAYKGPRLHCPNCGTGVLGFLDADLQPIRGQQQGGTTTTEKPVEVAA